MQCKGHRQWFPGLLSRAFTAHLPHYSNNLLDLHQPTRESPLSPPVGVQSRSIRDPGLVTHIHGLCSTSAPLDPDSIAASDDNNPYSDFGVPVPSHHQGMSTAPFGKDMTLGSPGCLFQSSLSNTLQRHGTSLKCHDNIIKLINIGLQRSTLDATNPSVKTR